MALCLFEDHSIPALLPLTHLHPDFDLRCGIFTGRERAQQYFAGESLLLRTREGLAGAMAERSGLPVNAETPADLYISGAALLRPPLVHAIREHRGEDMLFAAGDTLVAATAASATLQGEIQRWLDSGSMRGNPSPEAGRRFTQAEFSAPVSIVENEILRYPWDLIEANGTMLDADAEFFMLGEVDPSAHIAVTAEFVQTERIFIGPEARIGAGVVIDASEGPVVVDAGAVIMPQAVILGPAYIGPHARIKVAAKVYGNTSVGPWCKIGGEVEGTVFHSFANKQHDGFVGHSYFAPWTNLGADTNTSDLKNNYSTIRVTLEGREYDSGRTFLGTIMADHAKCGINTMFNTGTIVGVGCNVFGGGFPPKFLPSFSWGGAEDLQEYDFDRFSATAAIVMQRRGKTLTDHEIRLLRDVFAGTSLQRRFTS